MKVVVDTNIIFTALLREHNSTLEHLLLAQTEFYSMRYVLVELFKHWTIDKELIKGVSAKGFTSFYQLP